jgi:hypothetical protein
MNSLAGLLISIKNGLRREKDLVAKYVVRIQFSNRPSTEYNTDDIKQANSIVKRETQEAKRPTSNINAIFVNGKMKWRKPKEK